MGAREQELTILGSANAFMTKMDLAAAVEFDCSAAHGNIQAVRPGIQVLKVSAKSGGGMEECLDLLTARRDKLSVSAMV